MKKSGTNARVNELSAEQRRTLDDWMFENNLTYAQMFPRAQSELGFKGSIAGLKRYYQRRRHEMQLEKLAEAHQRLSEINAAPADFAALQEASMKMMACQLFQLLQEAPENVKAWAPLANFLLRHDQTTALRECRGEENKIRREAVEFAKEKYQFDMTEKALTVLPQLKELAEARKDPDTRRYEENVRRNKLRRGMFGPGHQVQPESAQEEAEMLAARAEREARKLQGAKRERVTEAGPPGPSSQYYKEYMEVMGREDGKTGKREDGKGLPDGHGKANDQQKLQAPGSQASTFAPDATADEPEKL